MKYGIIKMQAERFCNERKEPIKIAKANKKEDYHLLFGDAAPTKNYTVIEIVEPEEG